MSKQQQQQVEALLKGSKTPSEVLANLQLILELHPGLRNWRVVNETIDKATMAVCAEMYPLEKTAYDKTTSKDIVAMIVSRHIATIKSRLLVEAMGVCVYRLFGGSPKIIDAIAKQLEKEGFTCNFGVVSDCYDSGDDDEFEEVSNVEQSNLIVVSV